MPRQIDSDDPEAGEHEGKFQSLRSIPGGAQKAAERQADPDRKIAPLSEEMQQNIRGLGRPPRDPADLTVWFQRLMGEIAIDALLGDVGPGQVARMNVALSAADKAGKHAVKAIDRSKQTEVAKRVGVGSDESDDGDTQPYPGRTPPNVGGTR